MSAIYVCSLARLPETAMATKAKSLLTLLSPGGVVAERPPSIAADRHLVINVSDIVTPTEGHTHPQAGHIADLLAFFAAWDRVDPLLIHCYAGVSRSTAAAYIAVCALAPDRDESEVARSLRAASPSATPNASLVALADSVLGRAGRMSAAITAIGRGEDCFEGAPFRLDLDAPPA
ncbi:protein tyrosine phosphatase [Lichenihabitans sp. PAMC28606]|uniref:tyrosine phosphatase family protein n=1 Tax=Lichenihabitans sp. PAMC28606 TaxID=2880932 RepID=UPI001D09F285|nr:protein tyrosine phosphatase [Lichenihabitans sp. PAMC28606]UDL94940.1 protein tyrosine phosphatase [Lichenihabitans sp. PAMC28606]